MFVDIEGDNVADVDGPSRARSRTQDINGVIFSFDGTIAGREA